MHTKPMSRGHGNHEGHNVSVGGSGPKVFRSVVCNTHFPRRYRVWSNITKYDGKTKPYVWLEDYRLTS
jgi:hypothetical protein